jgi:pilus assembly protein Flp/PilA
MLSTMVLLTKLMRDRKAATAVEYGLVVSLIVIAGMIGIISLGGATSETWGNILAKVTAVTPG